MTQAEGTVRIGASGYHYEHWRDIFYPGDLSKDEWLGFYAQHFGTVEINNTFYHLPGEDTFDGWHGAAPPGFRFTLKFSRYGSHLKKLKDPAATIAAFLERAERLKSHLGPILVQLPPHWRADPARLAAFLEAAPARHRWALEFRDPSWLCPEIYAVLREHNAALCIHDLIPDHPRERTAGWHYLRFHGDPPGESYTPQTLSGAARRIRKHLSAGRDVYAYFNNDAEGRAIHDALALRRYLCG